MSLSHWFHPTWSGDFRLIRTGEFSCELSVQDPTAAELPVLATLMTAAKANGWVDADQGDDFVQLCKDAGGEITIPIRAPIVRTGPLVSGSVHGDAALWTAVRHEGGKVVVVSGSKLDPSEEAEAEVEAALDAADVVDEETAPPPYDGDKDVRLQAPCETCGAAINKTCVTMGANPRPRAPHKARKVATGALVPAAAALDKTAEAAATVRQPRRGCPAPTRCNRRASEVLRVFSTERQHDTFTRQGFMRVIGNRTGQAYFVFHRDEAAQRGLAHSLVEARTGNEVCVWDDRVPAEEEALALKLAIEHREGWLMRLPRGGRLASPRHIESWAGGRKVIPVIRPTPFDN